MNPGDWENMDRNFSLGDDFAGADGIEATIADVSSNPEVMKALSSSIRLAARDEAWFKDDTDGPGFSPERKQDIGARLLRHALGAIPVEASSSHDKGSRRSPPAFNLGGRSSRSTWFRIAAAVAVVVLGGGAAWWATGGFRAPAVDALQRTAATQAGERANFVLSDGTNVMLGPSSTLRYATKFGTGAREVFLEGEAFFAVTHDSARPFVVHAGDVVAVDLGTEFVARAYAGQAEPHVVVREGKVAFGRADAPAESRVVLAPGQLGRLDAARKPVVEVVDVDRYFAWTQGWLVLDGVPLREALPQLSQWYGVEFRIADSALGKIPVSARLRSKLSSESLDLLAASLGMRQGRDGDTVTFYPGPARQ